jgi:1,4-dihydroxy-6-naphthoate synthase
VAREPKPLEALAGARIALPGARTTATLVARGLLPPFEEVQLPFTDVLPAVVAGEVEAGVLIHEGQLTYADAGLVLIADLGELFARRHGGLPLPLGVNCARRDLDAGVQRAVGDAYRRSVEIALEQRAAAVDYALRFARGLPGDLADRFVGMYVNEDSLRVGDDMRAAVAVLEAEYPRHAEPVPRGARPAGPYTRAAGTAEPPR